MVFLWIIASIALFSCIVFIHEFWHFKLARLFKVKVEEFWLGIPPRAKKLFTDKTWTLFSLNWIPLGGFVRLKWEQQHIFFLYDEEKNILSSKEILSFIKKDKDFFDKSGKKITKEERKKIEEMLKENNDEDNLTNKPYWQQALIILGWVGMNFIFAIILLSFLFFIGVKPIGINDTIKTNRNVKLIPTFEQALKEWIILKKEWVLLFPVEKSISQKAWTQSWDILVAIDEKKVNSFEEVKNILSLSKNKLVNFEIQRKEKNIKLSITIASDGKIGAYIGENIIVNKDFLYKYWFFDSIKYGAIETYNQSFLTLDALSLLVKNLFSSDKKERTEAMQSVSGPVGIVEIVSKSLSLGFSFFILLGAMISINLWVFNLLPIPALDGGRFLFICINMISEKLTKRKWIPLHIEWFIHILFFLLLIAFSIIITYNDINKLLTK
jgi:regulator of sigma E protease